MPQQWVQICQNLKGLELRAAIGYDFRLTPKFMQLLCVRMETQNERYGSELRT